MATNSQHVKASGFGKAGALKKDGYAALKVPDQSVGWKRGTPYSGPNTATGTFSSGKS